MRVIKLDYSVVECHGNAAKFLNGLTSNSLESQANAFLNLHGRIIATVDQIRISDDIFILVMPSAVAESLLAHVARYAKLSQTTLTVLPVSVYADLDGDVKLDADDHAVSFGAGKLIVTKKVLLNTVSDDELTAFRLAHHLPFLLKDYKVDDMILNVHPTHFVSYTKGCYLGQEPVAKVYHRSKPTWKLVVRFADECSEEEKAKMTSVINDPATGRLRGFVFVKNNS